MVRPDPAKQLFAQLYEQADVVTEAATRELVRPWFDKTLFHCRSTQVRDYIAEAYGTWQQCQQFNLLPLAKQKQQQAQQQWLLERLDLQLNTLVQALFRGSIPDKRKLDKQKHQQWQEQQVADSQRLLNLYQQLSTYKEYETRLSDKVRVAQQNVQDSLLARPTRYQSQQGSNEQQQLIHAQQRLQRCQKAIAAVERAIAKLEEQNFSAELTGEVERS